MRIHHTFDYLSVVLVAAALAALVCGSCANEFVRHSHDYHALLQAYPAYNKAESSQVEFSYVRDDENLKNLRSIYALDAIAGTGDEVSRILNLMLWVNEHIKHDGNASNPFPPHTNNIIETCRTENRGVNCRMLATVLNEFYLSMGFASRIVTLKPFEHDFNDCHVVTVVYSSQYDRWIMMDPSFAGFFSDASGEFLGLIEIRERMINGIPMVVSEHLNHNRNSYSEELYRAYLAKNVFRFSSPLASAFNYEARDMSDREYIELLPAQYESPGGNYRYTRNPDVFWEKPPLIIPE